MKILRIYEKGLKQRRNAETSLNLASSRSHAILTLHVVRVPYDQRTDEVFEDIDVDLTQNASSLHLVDLAGSERAARTNAQVSFKTENYSLLFRKRHIILGRVVLPL